MNRDWAISRLLLVDSHSDAWCVLAWSQRSGARAAAASAGPFARWAMAAAASLAARANSAHLSARQPLVPHALRVLPSARAARAPPARLPYNRLIFVAAAGRVRSSAKTRGRG